MFPLLAAVVSVMHTLSSLARFPTALLARGVIARIIPAVTHLKNVHLLWFIQMSASVSR